ncbi:tetratricopeptide repeat protein [Pararobbsia silviterrae]|uniref:Tetratricopeptide repeat protein n=1 Tax=Pararobbsia silviterrae TaxID=1792498 RepID=A0A494Y9U9_9BURK|nr:tetratricopeptide repeat protein [Pararobbsia silviterrae]RKP58470.1 tetratricopeptide repeat protein [Pararobbsia silviterrae]
MDALAHLRLGKALQEIGHHAEAIALFDELLAQGPDPIDLRFHRGVSLGALGRVDAALADYRAVLARDPSHAGAANNAANALRRLGRHAEALDAFDAALAAHPDHPDLRLNRGAMAFEAGDLERALADFDALLARLPDHALGLNNRGNVLNRLGRHAEALAMFDRSIAARPDAMSAWVNRASALQGLARFDDAQASYARARALAPDAAIARWNASHLALLRGQYASGWPDYEARWASGVDLEPRRHTTLPEWRGADDLRGKRIVLWHEQGLGDTIQFCRYAPHVAARGARVVLEVQASLKRLVAASLPGIDVIATGEPPGPCDYATPLMSLPLALGTDADSIPAAPAYLTADPDDVERWRTRLAPRARSPRVGLAWSGNAAHRNDANRSMPVSALMPLADQADLYGIQKDVRAADRQTLSAHPSIRLPGTELGDFADTAALIATLDLVVTVDTSIAHLAGALGKPVWILLPALPDWRWQLGREDSPWYPSARLFRRPRDADWAPVVAAVAHFLANSFHLR